MDCSKTEVFLAELERMCNSFGSCSYGCQLYDFDIGTTCETWMFNHDNAKKAIGVVQEWSNSHQPKTRLSVLKEQYPNLVMNEHDNPRVCAGILYGFFSDSVCFDDCTKCWNTPIEEV